MSANGAVSFTEARKEGEDASMGLDMSVVLQGCLIHVFNCIYLSLNGLHRITHISQLCYNEVPLHRSTAKYGDETQWNETPVEQCQLDTSWWNTAPRI